MDDVELLYQFADDHGIDVDWLPMTRATSLSMPMPDGTYAINMDLMKIHSQAEHKTDLLHEVGHCMSGAFYNRWAARDVRQKHENRADKWAIRHAITPEALDDAIADGHLEMWDLAEYFGVTEEFMRKAVCLYTYGNMSAELYF